MKGIILAGGRGTRLRPFTHLIKKELLPVYDKPLIFYPLNTLRASGIKDIVIVTDPKNLGSFLEIIGDGKELGVRIRYAIQNEPLGMAHGLATARHLLGKNDPIAVINGDNIFEETFEKEVANFTKGAQIVITRVQDPERSGVIHFEGKRIVDIEEKPSSPSSNWIQTGFFLYDASVFALIEDLKPSRRGEYEITDLNNTYVRKGEMGYIKTKGRWFDAGTFDSLLEAANFIAQSRKAKKQDHVASGHRQE